MPTFLCPCSSSFPKKRLLGRQQGGALSAAAALVRKGALTHHRRRELCEKPRTPALALSSLCSGRGRCGRGRGGCGSRVAATLGARAASASDSCAASHVEGQVRTPGRATRPGCGGRRCCDRGARGSTSGAIGAITARRDGALRRTWISVAQGKASGSRGRRRSGGSGGSGGSLGCCCPSCRRSPCSRPPYPYPCSPRLCPPVVYALRAALAVRLLTLHSNGAREEGAVWNASGNYLVCSGRKTDVFTKRPGVLAIV
mmetsp:Transcript_41578/g.112255  ORF Transcript_41578/g.112255 Transcript_41578/m.112255 type:complete len:257 (-) Transcript_41578:194-964(-)